VPGPGPSSSRKPAGDEQAVAIEMAEPDDREAMLRMNDVMGSVQRDHVEDRECGRENSAQYRAAKGIIGGPQRAEDASITMRRASDEGDRQGQGVGTFHVLDVDAGQRCRRQPGFRSGRPGPGRRRRGPEEASHHGPFGI